MSFAIDLWLEVAKVVVGACFTILLGFITFYLKQEYDEHRKNTAFRRYMVGDPQLEEVEDEGELDELDTRFGDLRADMKTQHAEVRDELGAVRRLVERIAAQLEAHDDFDFTRGGRSAQDRQIDGGADD